jgi:hypothetical protein
MKKNAGAKAKRVSIKGKIFPTSFWFGQEIRSFEAFIEPLDFHLTFTYPVFSEKSAFVQRLITQFHP